MYPTSYEKKATLDMRAEKQSGSVSESGKQDESGTKARALPDHREGCKRGHLHACWGITKKSHPNHMVGVALILMSQQD